MKVWIRGEARAEAASAASWYESKARLGESFRSAFLAALRLIEERPALYAVVHRDLRRAPIHRFPYGVYFVHEAKQDQVTVYAVVHDARNPEIWKSRR